MEHVDITGILRDSMLPIVGTFPKDGWARLSFDEEGHLALLPRVAATCKEWRDAMIGSTQYAALRVAKAEFLQVKPAGLSPLGSRSRKKDMAVLASKYEAAFFFLSRSWSLQVQVCERLQTASLAELSTLELQSLRSKLQGGWGGTEIHPTPTKLLKPSSTTWITPSHRTT